MIGGTYSKSDEDECLADCVEVIAGKIVKRANLFTPRSRVNAVVDQRKREIFVIGGEVQNGIATSACEKYNVEQNTW